MPPLYKGEIMKVNFTDNLNVDTEGGKIFILPEKELIAEVFLKNYEYIFFYCLKDNGDGGMNSAKCIFYKHKKPQKIEINHPVRPIYNSDNLLVCQNCGRRIIKVYNEKIFAYSAKIICSCGADYDIRWDKEDVKYDKIDITKIFVD